MAINYFASRDSDDSIIKQISRIYGLDLDKINKEKDDLEHIMSVIEKNGGFETIHSVDAEIHFEILGKYFPNKVAEDIEKKKLKSENIAIMCSGKITSILDKDIDFNKIDNIIIEFNNQLYDFTDYGRTEVLDALKKQYGQQKIVRNNLNPSFGINIID